MKLACGTVVALGSLLSFAPAPAAQESAAGRRPQEVVVIGTFGGPNSVLRAVNDRGQAVGSSGVTSVNDSHALLWQDGQMIQLSPANASADCAADDINHHGAIAGYCENAAVVWRDGEMVRLDVPGFFQALATAINDKGAVVGASLDFALVQSGFLWQDGRVIELAGSGHTMDINQHGIAVGSVQDATGFQRGIIWPSAITRPRGNGP